MSTCTKFLLFLYFLIWFNEFLNVKILKWCKYTDLHFATGATGSGADLPGSVHVIQVSVAPYELLQICNILRSRLVIRRNNCASLQ